MTFLKHIGWLQLSALSTALLAGSASTFAQERSAKPLSATDFDKVFQLIKPHSGESRWMELDWYPSVWEARQKAAAEGKPLFLWAGSGGAPPAGC
jgi:hypothetical protein